MISISNQSHQWERLTELVNHAQHYGLNKLRAEELDELGMLYRQATAALARANSQGRDAEMIEYLNQLVGRAHGLVYGRSSRPPVRLGHLFGAEIPRTFRENWRYVAVAAGVTILFAALAYLLVNIDYRWSARLLGPGFPEAIEDFATSDKPAGEYFADAAEILGGANFSAMLMSNNIQVALKAFALGVTVGLGTLYVLVVNGLMLGAFLGIGAHCGRLTDVLAVVIPHGAIEIPAIFIAAGAVKLALGTVPIFIMAALIEGLLSPQRAGPLAANEARFLLGALVFAALVLYLGYGDRILTHTGRS